MSFTNKQISTIQNAIERQRGNSLEISTVWLESLLHRLKCAERGAFVHGHDHCDSCYEAWIEWLASKGKI